MEPLWILAAVTGLQIFVCIATGVLARSVYFSLLAVRHHRLVVERGVAELRATAAALQSAPQPPGGLHPAAGSALQAAPGLFAAHRRYWCRTCDAFCSPTRTGGIDVCPACAAPVAPMSDL